jgi:C-terminal processing protease CtpA/Prc
LVTKAAGTLAAAGQAGTQVPMAILVNAGALGLHDLQAAGAALIVQDGEDGLGAGGETYTMELADGLRVQLRTSELVAPDGSVGLQPDLILSPHVDVAQGDAALEAALTALRAPRSSPRSQRALLAPYLQVRPEQPYAQMAYPAWEYRLLALFRFWLAIHYYFPYKHLLDYSWDGVLEEFIPRLEAADDSLQYGLTMAELVTRIQDSHGRLTGSAALDAYLGTHVPPLWFTSVEGATVVRHLFVGDADQPAPVQVGEVVLAVDGEEIAARRARLERLVAASTPQALRWGVDRLVVGGPAGGETVLWVRDAAGQVRETRLRCSVTREELRALWAARGRAPLPVFGVLPPNVGYLDLERLTLAQVDEALEAVKQTPALICDMRGYPQGTAWALAPRLTDQPVTTARFQHPERHGPDPAFQSVMQGAQTATPSGPWRYAGRVAVLIDENARSQAEHTCLFLEAAAAVTFVGGPTQGANGNVTEVALPGGLTARFTGLDVRHADGRQLQRMGIQPHLPVAPTLEGTRHGRDEVLEAAIMFLTQPPS